MLASLPPRGSSVFFACFMLHARLSRVDHSLVSQSGSERREREEEEGTKKRRREEIRRLDDDEEEKENEAAARAFT